MFRLMGNPKSTRYNPDVAKALKDATGKEDDQKTKDGDKRKGSRGGAGQKKRKSKGRATKKGKGKGKGRGNKRPRDAEDDDDLGDEDEDGSGMEGPEDAQDTACLHHLLSFSIKVRHVTQLFLHFFSTSIF